MWLLRQIGVTACGLVTSVLTAVAVTTVSRLTGFDLFTFSFWVVIPVGALLTGFAAASGYYFGSLFFHCKANWFLLIQMVLIAGFTQLLIYYIEYSTMVLDNGVRVADFIPFWQYLDTTLTKSHYVIGRVSRDVGEVGSFGYWMAFIQFGGFLFGGLCVFGFLASKPVCVVCNMYLRPLMKREKSFGSLSAAAPYYDALFQHPVDGPEFAELIHSKAEATVTQGATRITTTLHGCPNCKRQLIEEKVQVWNGKDWKDANKLHRRVQIPEGVNLLKVFQG